MCRVGVVTEVQGGLPVGVEKAVSDDFPVGVGDMRGLGLSGLRRWDALCISPDHRPRSASRYRHCSHK